VNVSEGEGSEVAAILTEPQSLNSGNGVIEGGVQLVVDLVADTVFLATNDTNFDFQDLVHGSSALQELLGDLEVFCQRNG
jgi:hypothetical protein